MDNKIDITALNSLSDQEKQLALSILKEYANSGESKTLEALKWEP